ncbi:hypothetical protein RBSWK_03852 [Rhodopirellula baltica SWK14]|uniref:Uncharacterized protein n=1 Tax=Rhodopirellula baltica SWK14 TaxID=993516 RepID=L7CDR7_RHOBT|nr:hypothetical protein RBSWK_03852 [Rhodopirellula baltica SWK14]
MNAAGFHFGFSIQDMPSCDIKSKCSTGKQATPRGNEAIAGKLKQLIATSAFVVRPRRCCNAMAPSRSLK